MVFEGEFCLLISSSMNGGKIKASPVHENAPTKEIKSSKVFLTIILFIFVYNQN